MTTHLTSGISWTFLMAERTKLAKTFSSKLMTLTIFKTLAMTKRSKAQILKLDGKTTAK